MSVVVFVGPTISRTDAREILDAQYLPPAAAGDVYDAALSGPDAIAIIDGFFERVPAVWHKEILFAMSRGIPVYGSSSMGALRASELHPFGMHGVGRIFEWFRDGVLIDDDEVTVVHGEAESGYRGVSDAMVNIRDGLARACESRVISEQTREALVSAVKRRFYPDRSWRACLASARDLGMPASEIDALSAYVSQQRPDLKRDDAVQLLKTLAAAKAAGFERHVPNFSLPRRGIALPILERAARAESRWLHEAAPTRSRPSRAALARFVRLGAVDGRELFRRALYLTLLVREAKQLDVIPATADSAHVFLGGDGGGKDAKSVAKRIEDLENAVKDRLPARHELLLSVALILSGSDSETLDRFRRHCDRLSVVRSRGRGAAGVDLDADALMSWYAKRSSRDDLNAAQLAAEIETEESELIQELAAMYREESADE
jgi:hypothetical protein